MKTFVAAIVMMSGVAVGPSWATPDYDQVCNSSRLIASDRSACRKEMTAAETDARRAEIHQAYERKIAELVKAGRVRR